MKLNHKLLQQLLDLAIAKGEAGFTEHDVLSLNSAPETELIYHLDYLADKGFIIGEFIPIAFAIYGASPQSIRFVQGKITERGQEYFSGLKQQSTISFPRHNYG